MNEHKLLIERIESLVDRNNQPDWEDVVRRAEAPAREESPARTRRSTRSYLVRRLVPAFVVAAAFIAVGLIAPWQHGPSSTVMQRAAAAIGDEPILQAVLQNEDGSPANYIDLATGRAARVFSKTKVWYDKDRKYLYARIGYESGGVFTLDYTLLMTPAWSASSTGMSPGYSEEDIPLSALTGFFDDYHSVLEDGSAHVVGTGTLSEHDVTWIEWAPKPVGCPSFTPAESPSTCTERVAIDKASSLPLQIAWLHEGAVQDAVDILSIETLPAGSFDFPHPKIQTTRRRLAGLRADEVVATDLPGAAEAIPGALWPGRGISSLELTGVSRATLSGSWPSGFPAVLGTGTEITEAGIELRYGSGNMEILWPEHKTAQTEDGRGVVIHEQKANPRVGFWPWSYAAAPAGSLLTLPADNIYEVHGNVGEYLGWLEKDGIWVEIEASSRELLLEAARALKPIPK